MPVLDRENGRVHHGPLHGRDCGRDYVNENGRVLDDMTFCVNRERNIVRGWYSREINKVDSLDC